jgi:Rrf2 family protein
MYIYTRGRYALRVLIDLAEHSNGEYIPMKDVARRQDISLKYLEGILPAFTKNGLVDSAHGKGGGYRLTREPDQYSVWEVLQLTEGDLAPVSCLEKNAKPCSRASECRTLPMWEEYYRLTKEYFSKITIADLMKTNTSYNYVI